MKKKNSIIGKSKKILQKMYDGKKLNADDFSSEWQLTMVLNYLKDSGLIFFVWCLDKNENGLRIFSERITPQGIEVVESRKITRGDTKDIPKRKITRGDMNLSYSDYVVMAGDPKARFYEVFYKGNKIDDCRGVIRNSLRGVSEDEKKQ
mgnify:CR=1 FL=1